MTVPSLTTAKLRAKYGNGKPTGAAELLDFQQAMRAAGLGEVEACTLAAWMGGAADGEPRSGWSRFWDTNQTQNAAESCGSPFSPSQVLAMLQARDATLAELVQVKAAAKAVATAQNIRDNTAQDFGPLADFSDAGADVANWTGERAGDVLSGAADGLSAAAWLAKNIVWIVAGVLAVVVIGGGVYLYRNGQVVAKLAAKVAA